MTFHMTQTMLDLVLAAIARLDEQNPWAGIETMRGYYVTVGSSTIPTSVRMLATLKVDGALFHVCMNVVEYLDNLDPDQWQRPWDAGRPN